jgi:putative (di)nucleoside polyphosphate hydrolase
MSDAFFRAGVGAVVLDDDGRILVLKRQGAADQAWQLPQGGIGAAETPLDAVHRELLEETGLTRDDVKVVDRTDEWWIYELPQDYRNTKVGWGQAQQWFLCRLRTSRGNVRPDGVEVTSAEWVGADDLLRRATGFRQPTYRRLVQRFRLRQ